MNRIDAVLNRVEGPCVLDLGAVQHDASKADSDKWLHSQLASVVDTVIGVDILEDEIEKLISQGYDIRVGDVESMDFDICADTIVAGELIEHVSNPGRMLDRCYGHLKSGGLLILTTPNPWAIVHVTRWLSKSPQINREHVAWYGPVVLQQLLERHGFTEFECEGVRAPLSGVRHGMMRIAQSLGYEYFGANTWVCSARASRGGSA